MEGTAPGRGDGECVMRTRDGFSSSIKGKEGRPKRTSGSSQSHSPLCSSSRLNLIRFRTSKCS